jgi:hypothetical protein
MNKCILWIKNILSSKQPVYMHLRNTKHRQTRDRLYKNKKKEGHPLSEEACPCSQPVGPLSSASLEKLPILWLNQSQIKIDFLFFSASLLPFRKI